MELKRLCRAGARHGRATIRIEQDRSEFKSPKKDDRSVKKSILRQLFFCATSL